MAWWDRTLGGGQEKPPPRARSYGHSVYEDRDPIAFASDPDEPEAGWRWIGEFDRPSGAWVDGPHWHQPQRPWWVGK
jgi:hypothetical protein